LEGKEMAKIHSISIKNFRCFKNFNHTFDNSNFICLVGRGDSGKSTLLDSISYALSSSWNLTFFDSDFNNCNTNTAIEIEITLIELPDKLINEKKYGLHIRGIDENTNEIKDELKDYHKKALTIKLEIKKDLEPNWFVINNRQETPVPISSYDRAKFNVFLISDYVDRHFSWNKGTPLYSLLKQHDTDDLENSNIIIESLREAKIKIDDYSFGHFEDILNIIKLKANKLGIDISNTSTSIDFKDISIKDGRVCLHDNNIPFRLKGRERFKKINIYCNTNSISK
jgi:putative ATP-dependent endonuclease of the OLD family